jgi:acyl-homoserine-lactone acylase
MRLALLRSSRLLSTALALLLVAGSPSPGAAQLTAPASQGWEGLRDQVEITRTTRGIPHIRAENPAAAGFALGWVQMEDYGIRVVDLLLSARGETARHYGPGPNELRVVQDLRAKRTLRQAEAAFGTLPADLQGIYEGFALAVNRWLELHPEDAPPSLQPNFTGAQVLARDVTGANWGQAERYLRREGGRIATGLATQNAPTPIPADEEGAGVEPGSNVWALAPERTTSGHAILMRNPHLAWTAGYYEGHLIIEGDLEFYGDFRIGGPFSVIGGWNARLGWSTTNNGPELSDLYALQLDPNRPDHVLWEGESVPLERHSYAVELWNGTALETRSFEIRESPLGPVVGEHGGRAIVVRTAGDGEARLGQQFLAMMRAQEFEGWKAAMANLWRTQSNFTYADADGNIFYVWNAMHPDRPHAFEGDQVAHAVERASEAWQRILPFEALPQLLNPPGGYLRNENDPFHHTNLNVVMDPADFPAEAEAPRLRLRSQHSLELLHNDTRFSLEEIVALKGSERMLLADRVLDDLLVALEGARRRPDWSSELEGARVLLTQWDRTVAVDARGAVLFTEWWERYLASAGRASGGAESVGFAAPAERLFAQPWDASAPLTTPQGLADPSRAVEAFLAAVPATRHRWGQVDVAWGAIHRARQGTLDLAVSGCDGLLGCFRVIWFDEDSDGRRRVRGGDGWVSAVEFGPQPRAFTVLAYGQSARAGSPFHEDQLQDFVEHRMTPTAWSPQEIEAAQIRRYRPGGPD